MPRRIKTFTLSDEMCVELEKHSKSRETPMSQLVEQGLGMLFACPVGAAVRAPKSEEPHMTQTMRNLLKVLTLPDLDKRLKEAHNLSCEVPREFYLGFTLSRIAGCSPDVGDKNLRQLEFLGKVHRWGDGPLSSDAYPIGSTWFTRPALDVVRETLAEMQPWDPVRGRRSEDLDRLERVHQMALGMIDTGEVAKLILEVYRQDPRWKGNASWITVENYAQRAERLTKERDEDRAELEAERVAAVRKAQAQQQKEQAAARAYDVAASGRVNSDWDDSDWDSDGKGEPG